MSSKLLYKCMASVYDLLDGTYFGNYDRSPRKVVLQSIGQSDKVLDICTGTATNAINIAKQKPDAKVMGIDFSKDMLRIAHDKLAKAGIQNIRLKNMDATALDFKDKVFDKVLISLVLHEIDETLAKKILEEARRVLKDDGELIVTEWEPSKDTRRRLLFLPIHILEPKVYRSFIKKDLPLYFRNLHFQVVDIIQCDYSKVLKLKKVLE